MPDTPRPRPMVPYNVAIVRYVRRAFDFGGRSSRAEFWWPRLTIMIANFVLLVLFLQGAGIEWLEAFMLWADSGPTDFSGFPPLAPLSKFALTAMVVIGLLTFIPDLSVAWRRFHDLGQPGWFHLVAFLLTALFSLFALVELIVFAIPGQSGPNRYGPDPLRSQAEYF